ncbi:tetratricopeptide repeat protein [Streptomyces sp. NPDC002574]|uniref:tetratricopeptide repeat protein n=1 Tax=Streptomyces sp. NPDC002574 TaxID=3364652 RepID=UPI00369DECDB
MVLWNGVDFTADGREPTTAEEFYRIGRYCWDSGQYRAAAGFFLEPAANEGHALAGELLGHVRFAQGDPAGAVPWLRRNPDSPRAAYYLGVLSYQGCPEAGIRQSFDTAAEWYRRATALGEPEAMLALGEMYLERLVRLDRAPVDHALECFLPAARAGHPYAQYRVADLYRTSYADLQRAAHFYEMCLANPARERHTLNSLMTLQSAAFLREIRATQDMHRLEQRRNAVNPERPHDASY